MKSVLISIKPKWCKLIANGKKSVEIRKTRPKLYTPFKCYIYCTLNGTSKIPLEEYFNGKWHKKKGKVIGEFICDDITKFYPTMNLNELSINHIHIVDNSCVDMAELFKYANGKVLYAWHTSKFKIYDKPKELSEFRKYISFFDGESLAVLEEEGISNIRIKKAPQSWCYVEEVKS